MKCSWINRVMISIDSGTYLFISSPTRCGGQRTALGSRFSPVTLWDLEVKDHQACAAPVSTEPPCWPQKHLKNIIHCVCDACVCISKCVCVCRCTSGYRQGLSLNLSLLFFWVGWQPASLSHPPISSLRHRSQLWDYRDMQPWLGIQVQALKAGQEALGPWSGPHSLSFP